MVSYFRLIAAAIVMAIASPALAQMSPQECDALVPRIQQSVKDISTFVERLERSTTQELGPNRAPVADNLADIEKARVAAVGPLKQYLNAYQDLAYQLQRCAR